MVCFRMLGFRIACAVLLQFGVAAISSAQAPSPQFQTVTTIAGGRTAPPVLRAPHGIAVDPNTGVVFIADTKNHQIKTLAANGTLTVLAGSGVPGSADGRGSGAQFHEPSGLAYDAVHQVLYVADRHNHTVRRIAADGAVTTVAGGGKRGFVDGASAVARFDEPSAVAVSPTGELYVADTKNSAIRRIDLNGHVVTIAGQGSAGFADGPAVAARFAEPEGIVLRADGALLIADSGNHRIRMISGGSVTTVAGSGVDGTTDGTVAAATFRQPRGITLDETGAIYIADTGNGLIRRIANGTVTTISGSPDRRNVPAIVDGPVATATFDDPWAIVYAGALYVADAKHDAIRFVRPELRLGAVDPTRGPRAGGNAVRLLGSGFLPGRMSATFGTTVVADLTYVGGGELVAIAPAGSGGTVDVAVSNGIRTVMLPDAYSYVVPPTVTQVTPSTGPAVGGQNATIRGTEFITGATDVYFGTTPAGTVIVEDPTTATVTTPAVPAGTVDLTVRTEGGDATLPAAYTFMLPPEVTSFVPASGRTGTAVTIRGSHFSAVANENQIRFGPTPAIVVAATTTELITAVPAGASTGPISITTAGGTGVSAAAFTVVNFINLSVTPGVSAAVVGDTVQFHAIATRTDGTPVDVTAAATWTSSNATVVTMDASGLATARAVGSANVAAAFETFTASARVTIAAPEPLPPDPIAPPADPTVVPSFLEEVSFLFTGATPIQTGVAPQTIADERATVLRGIVRNTTGAPLGGVKVTIHNHPEFGETVSRADGGYDLVVNGGGTLHVSFAKAGHVPAHRLVVSKWNEYRIIDDVALVRYDDAVTTVTMNSSSMQVARGTSVSDEDGSRRATVLIPSGTSATLAFADGSTIAAPALSIRATEFTVGPFGPNAMPAALPPSSAYTYCVEMSADEAVAAGATEIRFSQPVFFYVENFVGFPVGGVVPTGYYDRQRATWIGSDNGRVLKVLTITAGLAELDANGDGAADSPTTLAALGINDFERATLATLYAAGQSLWRVPTNHFTPIDHNWPDWPLVPGAGAGSPNQPNPSWTPSGDNCNSGNEQGWSIVDCAGQTLSESIPIVGTPYSLEYNSARTARTRSKVKVQLTGAQPPVPLRAVELTADIAGRRIRQTFQPGANLSHTIDWDGADAYGRNVTGARNAEIEIAYVYDAYFATPGGLLNAWAQPGTGPMTSTSARMQVRLTQRFDVLLGSFNTRDTGFGGWGFSAQRFYDGVGRVLYEGNGTRRESDPKQTGESSLTTVAGTGECCNTGSDGPATSTKLTFPVSVAVAPDGTFYLSEGRTIRKVDRQGQLTTIAGRREQSGFTPDNQPAAGNPINAFDVAVAPDGTVYFNDSGNRRIRRIRAGLLETVAGTGQLPPHPTAVVNNVPAIAVPMQPRGIAFGPDGTLYVADLRRVFRVTVDGFASTIAGTGTSLAYQTGQTVRASAASLFCSEIAAAADGTLYVTGGGTILKITPDGSLLLVGGSPVTNPKVQDGQLATAGAIGNGVLGMAVASDGTLLVGENGISGQSGRVRAIAPNGVITTFAGDPTTRQFRLAPNGARARSTEVNYPFDIATGPDGSVYIADSELNAIRRAAEAFPAARRVGAILLPSADGARAYVFEGGRHVRTVDTMTADTIETLEYDNAGRLVAVQDPYGNRTTIEREADGTPAAVVAPGGQRTSLTLTDGHLSAVANPAREQISFTYNADGLLETLVDQRHGVHTFTYDENGLLTKDEDPRGGFIGLDRTGDARQYAVTRSSAEGRAQQYQVAAGADLVTRWVETAIDGLQTIKTGTPGGTTTTMPDGTTMSSTTASDPRFGMQAIFSKQFSISTAGGRSLALTHVREATLANADDPLSIQTVQQIIGRNGHLWTLAYDALTRHLEARTPAGRRATMVLDAKGAVTSIISPERATIAYTYDERGRLKTITAGARSLTLGYNTRNELTSVTDAAARTLTFSYDAAGRLKEQSLPGGRAMSFTYDAAGNLETATPGGSGSHTFDFNTANLLETYTRPDGAETRLSWDKDRNLRRTTLPDGETIEYEQDSQGRIGSLVTNDGTYIIGYAAQTGDVATIENPDGEITSFTFDGPLLTGTTWSGDISGTVTRSFDENLRLSSENGASYGYDHDGLLRSAGDLALHYDPETGLLSDTLLGRVSDHWSYNSFDEVETYEAKLDGVALATFTYVHDAAGRIRTMSEAMGGTPTVSVFNYDAAGQLDSVTRDGVVIAEYDYDGIGNRTAHRFVGGADMATYDGDRLSTYGDSTFQYYRSGALRSRTTGGATTTYGYDAFRNLRSVASPGRAIEYVIDGQHRRIGKKVNGVLVQGWLYSDHKVVVELDGAGMVASRFVYGSRRNVPDYMLKGGKTYRIVSDLIGSPRLVVDVADGTTAQRLAYDEYGKVLIDTNPGFQPFGFGGGLYDRDTGLLRMGARDYDAQLGNLCTGTEDE